MSIPTKIDCSEIGKYETELTRGAEILMRVFCAVSERLGCPRHWMVLRILPLDRRPI